MQRKQEISFASLVVITPIRYIMERSSHEVLEDDHGSDDGSLLLKDYSLFTSAPSSNCDPKNDAVGREVEQGNTVQKSSSSLFSPSLCVYFSLLAQEMGFERGNLVIVVDNAHIPLGADEYQLANEDACNEAFSRSLSAINTVSFPPPFLMMNDRDVSSSRWDSIEIRRVGAGNRSSRRLSHQAESDLGPQKPGRTRDDDSDTETQSIDKTMHHRFTERRSIKSPVLINKKTRRRQRGLRPIVATSHTTNTAELRKPHKKAPPGPSSSLDSTSRWLRELPRRGDIKPMPPDPKGLVRRRSPIRSDMRRHAAEDLNDDSSLTDDETRKQDPFRTQTSEWTAWFDMISSMTSRLHDPVGDDTNPAEDDGLISESIFKRRSEGSDLKPSDSGQVARWDEVTSLQRLRSLRTSNHPSSLVNQLLIIDNGSPTDLFQRVTQSPASHFKSEQTTKKNLNLLMGPGSPTDHFERDEGSVSAFFTKEATN